MILEKAEKKLEKTIDLLKKTGLVNVKDYPFYTELTKVPNDYQYIIEKEALIRLAKELHKDDFERILCDMYKDLIPIYVCNEDSYDYHRIDYRISSNIEEEIKKVIKKNIDDGKYEYKYNEFIDDYKKEFNIEKNESIDENHLKDFFADIIAANPYAYGEKHICDNIREKVLKEEVLSINYDIYTQADILQLYIKKLSPDFICKRLEELKNEVTIDVSEKILMKEFNKLWMSQIKQYFPDIWEKGKNLFLKSEYLKTIQQDRDYLHLNLDRQIDIAMTKAIGNNAEKKLNKVLFEEKSDFVSDVWKRIGSKFGIENLTSEQIRNLSLQDFTDIATSEMLGGRNLTERINKQKEIEATERYQINTEEKKEKPNKVECSIKCEIGDKLTKNYYNNRVVGSSEKLSTVDIFTFLQQTKEKGRAFLNNIVSETTGNRLDDDVRLTAKNVVERIINPMTEKQQFVVKEAMVQYVAQQKEVINSAVRISRCR